MTSRLRTVSSVVGLYKGTHGVVSDVYLTTPPRLTCTLHRRPTPRICDSPSIGYLHICQKTQTHIRGKWGIRVSAKESRFCRTGVLHTEELKCLSVLQMDNLSSSPSVWKRQGGRVYFCYWKTKWLSFPSCFNKEDLRRAYDGEGPC